MRNAVNCSPGACPRTKNTLPGGQLANPTPQRWFDPTAYTVPAAGFQGTPGRNTVIGPPVRRTDLAFAKRFPIAATRRLDVRAELFNGFNNSHLGAPATNISNPTAGIITAADDARNMQLAVRMIW